MIGLIGLISLISLILPHSSYALPEIKPSFPRLANYFLHWTVSESEARELAKFDLVILDAEVQERSRAELELIRRLNPAAVVFAYVPASEIRRDAASLQTIAPLRYKLGAQVPDDWYLKDAAGARRSFWPGTWIVDVTGVSPRASTSYGTMRWNEYLPEFVAREILNTGLWDGVFYDNAWDDIAHFARGVPDIDRNGLEDDPEYARTLWKEGLRIIYRNTIARVPQKFVLANDGPIYAPEVYGVLLENFPRKGWARHMDDLARVLREAKSPAVAILNANTFNTGKRDDWRAMRYGLASALAGGGYYSFDFGDQDHGQTWWYDEYGVFLGESAQNSPVQKFQSGKPIWMRDFEHGMVVVNPADVPQEVSLAIEVEKIRGTQDPAVNDGRITSTLQIDGKDGLIVLRPLEIILGAIFENGVFARVFDARGESVRAGFFAFDKSEKAGVILARADLDGDKISDKIKADSGNLEISYGDGRRFSFSPYGALWRGDLSVALGDVNRDGLTEIAVGQGLGGGQVRVYRPNGTLTAVPFFPFGAQYRGGVNVAVGDLNKDGFSEIVVGAGPGGGPQVRIFAGDGRLLSGGFFAYDPRFRGGVRVSVGDTDGDGNAEIFTGPGPGGGPQVRIFNGKGEPLSPGFFAFDRASRTGAVPIVADIDGDGRNEILAVTKEIL